MGKEGVWQDLVSVDVEKKSIMLRGRSGKEYSITPTSWNAKMSFEDLAEALSEGREFSVLVNLNDRAVLGVFEKRLIEEAENTPMDDFARALDDLIERFRENGMSDEELFVVLRDKMTEVSNRLLNLE